MRKDSFDLDYFFFIEECVLLLRGYVVVFSYSSFVVLNSSIVFLFFRVLRGLVGCFVYFRVSVEGVVVLEYSSVGDRG